MHLFILEEVPPLPSTQLKHGYWKHQAAAAPVNDMLTSLIYGTLQKMANLWKI